MFFNSKTIAWGDHRLYFNGKLVLKLTAISYKKTKATEAIYAAGDEPVDIAKGQSSYTGSMTFTQEAFDQANEAAKAAGYNDITEMTDLVLVNEYKAAANRQMQLDTLIGVSIAEFEKSLKSGDLKGEVTMPFVFMNIV